MKKVLFATTALIATATVASAEVTVGGFGYVGAAYDSSAAKKVSVAHAVRLTFSATVDTDAGVTFSAFSRITNANNVAGAFNYNRIEIKSGGLSVRVGSTHGAMKTLARTATFHGFNDGGSLYTGGGAGIDNNVGLGDGGNNVLVQYKAGDFAVAAATNVAGTVSEIAASYSVNGFKVGVGADNGKQWQLALGYSAGNFAVGLGTNDNQDIVATANYKVSAATSINVGIDKPKVGNATTGLQVSHDLGGANLVANIGRTGAGNNVGGLGVIFNF